MATLHDDFEHEMVDGAFAQDEVDALKIQGVPSVVHDGTLMSSGRSNLADLLGKLESTLGVTEAEREPVDLGDYDVVVVGGGPAGAASAIYTARKGLKTAVISDRLGGQLQDTKGIENLISVPYTEGPELTADLGKHLSHYDIEVLEHRKVAEVEPGDVVGLTLDSGETLKADSLIVATGAKWRELGVDGEMEYLGRGVAFCPHCDGPFYKGKDVAVVGGGNSGVEAAIDLAGIVKTVTVVEFLPELKADAVLVEKLESLPNASVVRNARTTRVLGDGETVVGLEYEDRSSGQTKQLEVAGVFVQIGLLPNSGFISDLVETNAYGEIVVDDKCRTSQRNVYAAGDVTNVPYKQIVVAIGEGAKAGLAAFEDRVLVA
jgi:alkyl hydroperoxide reductase subunit F